MIWIPGQVVSEALQRRWESCTKMHVMVWTDKQIEDHGVPEDHSSAQTPFHDHGLETVSATNKTRKSFTDVGEICCEHGKHGNDVARDERQSESANKSRIPTSKSSARLVWTWTSYTSKAPHLAFWQYFLPLSSPSRTILSCERRPKLSRAQTS